MRRVFVSIAAIFLAGTLLVACANKNDPQQPAKAALLGCETVTAQLEILLPLRRDGKLPQTALDILDKQRDIVRPFCLGPAPDVNSTWVAVAVDGAARSLTSIAASFQ